LEARCGRFASSILELRRKEDLMVVVEDRLPELEAAPTRATTVAELETLWHEPAVSPKGERTPGRRLIAAVDEQVGLLLLGGWIAFFLSTLALEPAPDPNASVPLWGAFIVGGFFVALFAAGIVAVTGFGRAALGLAALGGALGMATAIACTATGHHGGSFWAYELAAATVLTGLALLGLKRARD
jgi:hypothetical protein